ncbi:MAG TPA: hypothetical protein VFK69_02185 [Candidatus Eisenbacteria bacterium]|nr:hypothetical protein [Candidatus Eisenbacteria bacterium]
MPKLTLRHYETRVLAEASTSDSTLVPVGGAPVVPHYLGATVRTAVTISGGAAVAVDVYDTGRLAVGSTVQNGTDSSTNTMTITAMNLASGPTVTIHNTGTDAIPLERGSRLVRTDSFPTVYNEATGTWAATSAPIADGEGYIGFYVAETRYDIIVTIFGADYISYLLYEDVEGGWMRGGVAWVNARDYPTIQATIDALPTGGG